MIINLYSYSIKYRKAAPVENPNFIFDCRGIINPGRVPTLKALTGKDDMIKKFLESDNNAMAFRDSIKTIIIDNIHVFIEKQYTNEMHIGFCCTGGKHRSVYFSEFFLKLYENLNNIQANIIHLDMDNNYC